MNAAYEAHIWRDTLFLILLTIPANQARAEETIATENPIVAELEAQEKTENRGIGFGVGVAVKIAGPLKIFLEAEYSIMTRVGRNQYGRANPELGGFCLSGGIQFVL